MNFSSKKTCFFLVLGITIFTSCYNKNSKWYKEFNPESTIVQVGAIDSLEGTNMASPYNIHVKNDLLIIEDIKLDQFIHFIDSKEMSFIKSEGKKGKGPGEIITTFGKVGFFGDHFWFYDDKLAKYVGYNIDSTLHYSNYVPINNEIKIDPELFLSHVDWLSKNEIIGYGFHEDKFKYTIINIKNDSIYRVGDLPPNPDNIPNLIHKQVYNGYFAVNPSDKKIAFASNKTDLVEIYDLATNKTLRLKSKNGFNPMFDIVDRGDGFLIMGLRGETRIAYKFIAISRNRIYCLFSGQTMDESFNEQNASIHVFNWEGDFEKTIQLDRSAKSIAVDEDDHFLYSVIDTEIPTILKYRLNEVQE